jgi:hypothetical protein
MPKRDHQNADKRATPHLYRIYIPTGGPRHGQVFEKRELAESVFADVINELDPLLRTGCELQSWIPSSVLVRHAGEDNITR